MGPRQEKLLEAVSHDKDFDLDCYAQALICRRGTSTLPMETLGNSAFKDITTESAGAKGERVVGRLGLLGSTV
jgi:hypothetical protein